MGEYVIEGFNTEEITENFYEQELQKAKQSILKIEKVKEAGFV